MNNLAFDAQEVYQSEPFVGSANADLAFNQPPPDLQQQYPDLARMNIGSEEQLQLSGEQNVSQDHQGYASSGY